jgi:hypothetical protein
MPTATRRRRPIHTGLTVEASSPWGYAGSQPSPLALTALEKRSPLWARVAPCLYLLASAAAVRAVIVNNSDAGLAGVLVVMGFVSVFAIPAVFDTRRTQISVTDVGVIIDGAIEKVDDARLERAPRGGAVLHLVMRDGRTRSFIVESYKDAQRLVAALPPASAPAGMFAAA